MGPLGAACFHTLSTVERELTKEQWEKERVGQICTKSEYFADWKKAMLQLCSDTKRCNFEEVKAGIAAFEGRLSRVAARRRK